MVMITFTMKHLASLLVFAAAVCSTTGLFDYRCDILGCENGATDCHDSTFECTCANGKVGPQCATPETCVGVTCVEAHTVTASTKCSPAGKCICLEGYYGDSCENEMVRATCDAANLKIYVHLYPQYGATPTYFESKAYYSTDPTKFNGNIETDVTCKVLTVTDGVLKMETIPAPGTTDTSDCVQALLENDKQVYYVYVQQIPGYKTFSDQIFRVECDPATELGASITTLESSSQSSPIDPASSSSLGGVVMKIRKVTGTTLADISEGSSVPLGQTLALTIEAPAHLVVKECKASDGSGNTALTTTLVDGMCVPKGAAPLYKEPIKALLPGDTALPTGSEANHMIQILLRAWKYSGSTLNALEFKCTVCKDQACTGLGTVPTCDDATTVKVGMSTSMLGWFGSLTPPPVGRRRREVISSANETTLNVAITVSNGQVDVTVNEESESSSTDVASCYKSTSVLLPIILLAALLLVAMVMTFFFCRRLTNELEHKEGNSNMAYKS